MLKNKIKKLTLFGSFLASSIIPSLALSINYDQKSNANDVKHLNTKFNPLSKMLVYDNKIFNNKEQVVNYYLKQHPEAIGNKNVIGDIKKAIIDFDYNVLNQRKLKEFHPSLASPVYRSAAREQTKDFNFARKSKINPAFTTYNYTDGFDNFFDYKNIAKNSFSKHLVPGQIGLQNISLLDGKNAFYNPLSINDYNSYFINAKKSLQNYQSNKLNLPSHYARQYFDKNNKKIESFNDIFKNKALLKLFNKEQNNEFDNYLQMKNVEKAVNNYNLQTTTKISNLVPNIAINLEDYNLKLTSLKNNFFIKDKKNHISKLNEDLNYSEDQVTKLTKEIKNLEDNKKYYQDKINNDEQKTIYNCWVTIRVKTDYYDDDGHIGFNSYENKYFWNKYWNNLSHYDVENIINNTIDNNKHLISFDKSRSSFKLINSVASSRQYEVVIPRGAALYRQQDKPSFWDSRRTRALIEDVTIPYRYNYINSLDSRSWEYKKNIYLKKISDFQKQINIKKRKAIDLNKKIHNIKKEKNENRIYIKQFGKPVLFEEIKNINNPSCSSNVYKSVLNGTIGTGTGLQDFGNGQTTNKNRFSLSYDQFKNIVENDRPANKNIIKSKIGHDNSLYLWLNNINNPNQEALYSVNLQNINNNNIFTLMDSVVDKSNLKLIFDFSNLNFSNGNINNIKVYWKLYKDYPKFKNATDPSQKLNLNQIKKLDMNKDYLFSKLQSKIEGFNNLYENISRLNTLKSFLNNYNKNIYEVITYNQLPILKVIRNSKSAIQDVVPYSQNGSKYEIQKLLSVFKNSKLAIQDLISYSQNKSKYEIQKLLSVFKNIKLAIQDIIPYSQNQSKYEIQKLLSVFKNSKSLYDEYINNNLESFKETLKVSHFKSDLQPGFETAAYYYFLTLKDYIDRTSIIGKLPKALNFKLPEKIDNFNLFANTPIVRKKYWILNQYIFNGSILSKAGLDHISSTNIYMINDKQQETLMQKAKEKYTKYFNPPLVSHLYDANGKEVVSDGSGYSMYDSLGIIIENARLTIMPDRDLNTVFYGSMYKPIKNVVSNIYVLHYEKQVYCFMDYQSLKSFLKLKLMEHVRTYVRKDM